MARTLTRAQQVYPAGTYGPFAIDSLTRDDTERIEAILTVVGWPVVSPLMQVEIAWDTGGKVVFDVGGEQKAPDGTPLTEVRFSVGVPKAAGVKRQVSGGSFKVTTFAPLTTAITVRAV